MELQTEVNPCLGKLHQEGHRYAWSVISKAANLEGFGDFIYSEISTLVDRYATWLIFNLTEPGHSTTILDNSHDAVSKMIGDLYAQINPPRQWPVPDQLINWKIWNDWNMKI